MKRTNNTICIIALLLLLLFKGTLLAETYPLIKQSSDWSKAGEIARKDQGLLLVLFVSNNCGYCKKLKAEYLCPMLQKNKYHLILREVNIDNGGKIIDFDGIPIRSRIFTRRYDIFATPTLAFLDSRGNVLTSSIVGYDNPENYQTHLQKALSSSKITLKKNNSLSY